MCQPARRLPVLRCQHLSAATNVFVLRSRIAPCMSYGMKLWRPAKRGANMTAVLVRAGKHVSGICRDASHTAFSMGRSAYQDVMLADLDVLSADDHCRMAHARQNARQTAAATAAALYAHNHTCLPEFDVELSAAYAPDYMGTAAWNGLHTLDAWYSFARTRHDTRYHTASTPRLHRHTLCQSWWGVPSVPHAKTSGAGSVRWHSYAGACVSLHTGYTVGLAKRCSIDAPGGWQTPRRGNTSGTLPSGRSVPMHSGGCAPGHVITVVTSCRRSSFCFAWLEGQHESMCLD